MFKVKAACWCCRGKGYVSVKDPIWKDWIFSKVCHVCRGKKYV